MTSSTLTKNFTDEINSVIRHAFHVHNRVKIAKTEYVEKLWQLKRLEKELKTLQRNYNTMTQKYSAIQEYILEKNPIFGLEVYDLQHMCKGLRQLYHLIQMVKVSFYDSLRSCEQNLLTFN